MSHPLGGQQAQVQLVIHVGYHQLYLAPLDVSPSLEGHDLGDGRSGPLAIVTNGDSALVMFTGCADGPVDLRVCLHHAPPPVTDSTWEECAEVSMVVREPLIPSAPTVYEFHDPVLTEATPGRYRVRISARGRGTNYDSTVFEVTEWYLVEFWPEGT